MWNWLFKMIVWAEATDILVDEPEEQYVEIELLPTEHIESIEIVDG